LWSDLDRDRRVGGSRPHQNDCFFSVILVTHPKSHNRDDGSPRFRRQTIKVKVREDGCYREKFRNFVVWAEPDKKKQHLFRVLGYPSTVLRTAYRKQFYPKPMAPMES